MPCRAPVAIAATVMPSNTRSAPAREQHAVLEGAGLALVGVADHVAHAARRAAAGLPLGRDREAGAAASAQPGAIDLPDQGRGAVVRRRGRARRGWRRPAPGRGRAAIRRGGCCHRSGTAPRASRRAGVARVSAAPISPTRAASRRAIARPFTSMPGPWSHSPVQDVVATLSSPSSLIRPGSTHSSRHNWASSASLPCMLIRDVVREQDAVLAPGLGGQEGIEARGAAHPRERQAQGLGELFQRGGGKEIEGGLARPPAAAAGGVVRGHGVRAPPPRHCGFPWNCCCTDAARSPRPDHGRRLHHRCAHAMPAAVAASRLRVRAWPGRSARWGYGWRVRQCPASWVILWQAHSMIAECYGRLTRLRVDRISVRGQNPAVRDARQGSSAAWRQFRLPGLRIPPNKAVPCSRPS